MIFNQQNFVVDLRRIISLVLFHSHSFVFFDLTSNIITTLNILNNYVVSQWINHVFTSPHELMSILLVIFNLVSNMLIEKLKNP